MLIERRRKFILSVFFGVRISADYHYAGACSNSHASVNLFAGIAVTRLALR